MKSGMVLSVIVAVAMAVSGSPASAVDSGDEAPAAGLALFDGHIVDLQQGWGEAEACLVWASDVMVECFRSEVELLERASELMASSARAMAGEFAVLATCSSSLALYDGSSYTGSALHLYQRSTWMNLADYGWDNRTSSFKVGACSSYFADVANGGGSWYPTGSTQAWDVAPSMISGWNNRVGSIYIN